MITRMLHKLKLVSHAGSPHELVMLHRFPLEFVFKCTDLLCNTATPEVYTGKVEKVKRPD